MTNGHITCAIGRSISQSHNRNRHMLCMAEMSLFTPYESHHISYRSLCSVRGRKASPSSLWMCAKQSTLSKVTYSLTVRCRLQFIYESIAIWFEIYLPFPHQDWQVNIYKSNAKFQMKLTVSYRRADSSPPFLSIEDFT